MRKSIEKQIKEAQQELVNADNKLKKLLAEKYPAGSFVDFYYQHNQRRLSRGQVISHPGGEFAYIRVVFGKGIARNITIDSIEEDK